MPYSDVPPPYVLPNASFCRSEYEKLINRQEVELCFDWAYDRYEEGRCKNRSSDGVRTKNWCYRCPAGYIAVNLHKYDAERDRDRALLLHSK